MSEVVGVDLLYWQHPGWVLTVQQRKKDYSRHLLYLPSRFLICCFSPGCVLCVGGQHRDDGPHELLIARSGPHGVVSPAHFVYELTEQTSLVFGTECAILNVTCPRDRTSDRPVAVCRSTCGF